MSSFAHPRPEILGRIPPGGHVIIEASAGTGKTFTLEHLVVELLLSASTTIDRILVVTFTDKGARELRTRVRSTIESILAVDPETAPALGPDEPHWQIDEKGRARLEKAILEFDSASISTIHGFCQGVLTEFSFDTLRLFDGEQVDGGRVFSEVLRDQMRTILATDHPARVYLETLIESGVKFDNVENTLRQCHRERSTITPPFDPDGFSRALSRIPAIEDEASLKAQLKSGGVKHGGTQNAILRRWHLIHGIAEAYASTELTEPMALQACCDWFNKTTAKLDSLSYLELKLGKALAEGSEPAAFLDALYDLVATTTTVEGALVSLWLPEIQRAIDESKREHGQFDFDDMLTMVRDGLVGPGSDSLTSALRGRYDCALIDEFQDTDEVQWEIFGRLFFESTAGHRLFLIGDPKQAIYGFRNADVHTYLAARDAVADSSTPPLSLLTNYRSSEALIQAVEGILLDGDEQAFFGQGRIEYPGRMSCGRPKLRAVDTAGAPIKPMTIMRIGAAWPLSALQIRQGLSEAVALQIRALLDPSTGMRFGEPGSIKPLAASDIHVLVRTGAEGRTVADALREAGVAHAFFKQDGLFSTDEAEDVLHLLQAIARPADRSARLRAWIGPFFGLTLAQASQCSELPADHPLVKRLRTFKALADAGRFEKLFGRIVSDTNIVGREVFADSSGRAVTNTLHIIEILLEESRRSASTLPDLIRALQSWKANRGLPSHESGDTQRLESDAHAVQILTMHKAKGLQAAVVFLAGGLSQFRAGPLKLYHEGDRRLSHLSGAPTPPDIDNAIAAEAEMENLRLLYVAMTRARVKLFVPYLGQAPDWAQAPPETVSQWTLSPSAGHRLLNERLERIFRSEDAARMQPLADWLEVAGGAGAIATAQLDSTSTAPLELPPYLFEPEPDTRSMFEQARRRHAGFIVTSYSSLRDGESAGRESTQKAETDLTEQMATPIDDGLPGGLATGTFLHEVLEDVTFTDALDRPDPAEWARIPLVEQSLRTRAARNGILSEHIDRARDMLHRTLRSPVSLGSSTLAQGLASIGKPLKEMEFLYPIPEAAHPLLSIASARPPDHGRPFRVERGLIRGFVDLIFEHEGRVYFADYKSDSLGSWNPQHVADHVADHYRLQARIYSLALVRMLELTDRKRYEERFGGLLYLFLRGMQMGGDGTAGVYFERPEFEAIGRWEREFEARGYRTAGMGNRLARGTLEVTT